MLFGEYFLKIDLSIYDKVEYGIFHKKRIYSCFLNRIYIFSENKCLFTKNDIHLHIEDEVFEDKLFYY